MNNLKERVNLMNVKNIDLLRKYAQENRDTKKLSEFIEILLNICPNINDNKCSDRNKLTLEVGINKGTKFYKLSTSVCYDPLVLPFVVNNKRENLNPVVRIKECNEDINVATIYLKNVTDIKIDDYSIPVNKIRRYKISFKYKFYFGDNKWNFKYINYHLDLQINQ